MNKQYEPNGLLNFTVADVNINEIAHSLSQICRFAGGTDPFYSVAEHSVIVSEIVFDSVAINQEDKKVNALYALFHDAHEAYIGDIVRGFKNVFPELFSSSKFAKFEFNIQKSILQAEKLCNPNFNYHIESIAFADKEIVNVELYKFFGMDRWESTTGLARRKLLEDKIVGLQPKDAEKLFLSMRSALRHMLRM